NNAIRALSPDTISIGLPPLKTSVLRNTGTSNRGDVGNSILYKGLNSLICPTQIIIKILLYVYELIAIWFIILLISGVVTHWLQSEMLKNTVSLLISLCSLLRGIAKKTLRVPISISLRRMRIRLLHCVRVPNLLISLRLSCRLLVISHLIRSLLKLSCYVLTNSIHIHHLATSITRIPLTWLPLSMAKD